MSPPGQPRTSQGLRACGRRCGVIVADCCGSGSSREILKELCDLLLDVLGLRVLASEASRVGGTLGGVLRDGSDGWRSPVPRGDNTGGRDHLPPQPAIAFQSRRQIQYIVTASFIMCIVTGSSMFWVFGSLYSTTLRRHSLSVRTLRRPWCRLLRQRLSDSISTLRRP